MRTLGLDDPQVFAQLAEDAAQDDDAPIGDGMIVSLALFPVSILYVADSAAG